MRKILPILFFGAFSFSGWSQSSPVCVNVDYKSRDYNAAYTSATLEMISNGGYITSGLDIDFLGEEPTYTEISVSRPSGLTWAFYTGAATIVEHKEAPNGDIYVLGSFAGALQVTYSSNPLIYTCPENGECFFLARHGNSMNFLDMKVIAAQPSTVQYSYVRPTSMAIDPATGNVFVSGYFSGSANIPGAGIYTVTSGSNGFIVRYSPALTSLSGKVFTGNCVIKDLSVNGSDLYVLGSFVSPLEGLVSAGSNDVFYGKYNFGLSKVWAKSIGSTANERGAELRYDVFDNTLAIVGYHASAFDMNPSPSATTMASFYGGTDSFYARYAASTGDFVTGKTIVGGAGTDEITDFELDGPNSFLFAGNFNGSLTIPQVTATSGSGDLFFGRYKANNNEWFKVLQNANPQSAFAIARSGNDVLVAGQYWKTMDADPGAEVETYSNINLGNNYWSNFIARYNCELCQTAPRADIIQESGQYVCPGGQETINGTITATGPWVLTLSDNGGTVTGVGSGTWSRQVSPSQTTTYKIQSIQDANCVGSSLNGFTTITVYNFTAGEILGTQTICSGGDPGPLTAVVPHYGPQSRWEKSTDLITWTSIDGSVSVQNYDPPAGLNEKTHYRKKVWKGNESTGCWYYSNIVTVTVILPPIPSVTVVGSVCDQYVTLKAYGTGATSYLWSTSNVLQTVNMLSSGTYSVTAFYPTGCSRTSNPITITIPSCPPPQDPDPNPDPDPCITARNPDEPCPIAIRNTELLITKITAFPNPADAELIIAFPEPAEADVLVRMYSPFGQIVHQDIVRSGDSKIALSTRELRGGIYLIKLNVRTQKEFNKKVLVQH